MGGNLKIRQWVFLHVTHLLDLSYISTKYYQIWGILWRQMDWQTDGWTDSHTDGCSGVWPWGIVYIILSYAMIWLCFKYQRLPSSGCWDINVKKKICPKTLLKWVWPNVFTPKTRSRVWPWDIVLGTLRFPMIWLCLKMWKGSSSDCWDINVQKTSS